MNKNIVFTLTNGLGTINVSEDSILYMHQNNDSAVGGYVLSVDEDKDRETIYVVDEDIATLEAAASKMFSVTLSAEDQAISINSSRVSSLVPELWKSYSEGLSPRLQATLFNVNTPEEIADVSIGDTIIVTSLGVEVDVVAINSTTQLEVTPSFGGIFLDQPYKIFKGQNPITRVFYRGMGTDLDVRLSSESDTDIQTTINAL